MTDERPKVKVYSTPTCPWCQRAKQFLKDHNIAFEDLNVAEDDAARDAMVEKSGQMGVPVIEIGDKIIVGFDKQSLMEELGIKE